MEEKVLWGQFFTKKDYWLAGKKQIINFVKDNINCDTTILDPFYGDGDLVDTLVNVLSLSSTNKIVGMDIDPNKTQYNVYLNDSLLTLGKSNYYNIENTFLVTNPPYLAKVIAKRKGLENDTYHYYKNSELNDLYKISLNLMISSGMPGVAIVPESFINSKLFLKLHDKIDLITIVIPNPFEDTSVPVCVVAFNGKDIKEKNTKFYINEKYIYSFNYFLEIKNKIKSEKKYKLIFNSKNGQIGLKAVDSGSKKDIKFVNSNVFNYAKNKIKISSRMMTYIYISEEILSNINLNKIIKESNKILKYWRKESQDLTMTPFKGNGVFENKKTLYRRRRLDYKTARWILEKAINNLSKTI